jgi:hypothetical protein
VAPERPQVVVCADPEHGEAVQTQKDTDPKGVSMPVSNYPCKDGPDVIHDRHISVSAVAPQRAVVVSSRGLEYHGEDCKYRLDLYVFWKKYGRLALSRLNAGEHEGYERRMPRFNPSRVYGSDRSIGDKQRLMGHGWGQGGRPWSITMRERSPPL